MTYATGHVKRNPATNEVAVRTIFDPEDGPQFAAAAWLIASTGSGPRSAKTEDVESWDDVYTPTEGS